MEIYSTNNNQECKKTKQLQYNIKIQRSDASHFRLKSEYAKSFRNEMRNIYLRVNLNLFVLLRRGMLDICVDWNASQFIVNVILNSNMLIIKQEPIEYHMCFH